MRHPPHQSPLPIAARPPNASSSLSDECLAAAEGLARIGFVAWEGGQPVLQVSEIARDLLGLAPGTVLHPADVLKLVAPEDEARLREVCVAALALGQASASGEFEARLPTGERRRFSAFVRISYGEDGGLARGVLALQDITGQCITRQSLAESDARLDEAQRTARFGFWEVDFETKRGVISEAARVLLNCAPDWQPHPRTMIELVPPDQREWVSALYAEAMAQRQPLLRYEVAHPQPDGSSMVIHSLVKIDFNEEGKPRRILATFQDITELKSYRKQLHAASYIDAVTGLPNRALFLDTLGQALASLPRNGQQLGLIMLDLDRFKDINDSMGHGTGDSLLKQAAQRLQQVLRGNDTVARLGGDEFAVVLPEVRQASDLSSVAQKVLSAFQVPFKLHGQDVFITASMGGALSPQDAQEVDQLMQHADAALYFAKSKGRNNFQYYARELTARVSERLTVENDLRKALEHGELELHYQPKYELGGRQLVGAEALMRWNHPQRGMVAPLNFISIAEDTGLIVPMGAWALHTACAAAVQWNAGRSEALKIAVNLSVRQLASGDFAQVVRQALQATGCQAAWLELEITESLLLDGRQDVLDILQEVSSLGISIAIDDFGTGYSALSYLTRFPVQVLKIDRSFIKDLPGDRSSAELVKAIVSLGHSLNMTLVAEGIETQAQAGHLTGLGCQLVQGYLFGRPMPHADFTALAKQAWLPDCQAALGE